MNFYEQLFSRGRTTGEGMTHFERLFAAKFGGSPPPEVREYTGAVPVTITADGTPLIDYLISGNMSQTGTPTPDNPIQPQETGERTGNLYNGEIEQGSFITTTGKEYSSDTRIRTTFFNKLGTGLHTISANGVDSVVLYAYRESNTESFDSTASEISWQSLPYTFTLNNERYIRLAFRKDDTNPPIAPNDISNIMLNTGSTALPYSPYGIKIPISSNSTTAQIYLGEVETTRKIRKLVLTGEETAVIAAAITATNAFQFPTVTADYKREPFICSHMPVNANSTSADTHGYYGQRLTICFDKAMGLDTTDKVQAYLAQQYAAGTPVCVWYVLATPTTGIVNEPIRKIGDYADTVSMEQAQASIPTNNGSTTVDVETTLKPSEVYIKYMG